MSCPGQEDRGQGGAATPAPSTPFAYSPMGPYGPINPYSFMSRYSGAGPPHMPSAFSSPLASSLAAGLAYPADIFHYNPYSALAPTSPLTPSSFWSLTAQQSFHQLNGITFGPSGPISYNTNAHLFNLFSPNSLSPMSPSPDLHSPSLYPRVSSLPSPYASSPGLSSAFMSPSSMPLLLSPSLSSSIDRPPTYLSDNASTPSTTPSIKCEPIDHNCGAQHQTSHTPNHNINDNSVDSNDKHSDKVSKSVDRHHKTSYKQQINNNSKQSLKHSIDSEAKQQSYQSKTTTITTSTPKTVKAKEKNSVRVEPLFRNETTVDINDKIGVNDINGSDVVACDLTDKRSDNSKHNRHKTCKTTIDKLVDLTQNSEESRDKTPLNDTNKDKDEVKEVKSVNPRVKWETICGTECDMRLPSDSFKSVNSVPNSDDVNSDSNTNDVILNVDTDSSPTHKQTIDNTESSHRLDEMTQKNLTSDDNSNSNCSDGKPLTIVCNGDSVSPKTVLETKKMTKDAKRESQLKQLQSYRKESHRTKAKQQLVNGIESGAAISIVLPKPKNVDTNEHKKHSLSGKMANQSVSSSKAISPTVLSSTLSPVSPAQTPPVSTQSEVQSKTAVVTCCTKPLSNTMTSNSAGDSSNGCANLLTQHKSNNKFDKPISNDPNLSNGPKLATSHATKQLPKKPRISRKPPTTGIPVGIAIAQQRTSPKTKSPNDSAVNVSQPLKPILPTLSLPMMANSPILITDSPPTGTSLWIKPTANSTVTNASTIQTNSQFSLNGDYQLARDSLTGHLYLIRNSSSLPTTPTATTGPKPPALIPPLNIKGEQSKSNPSAIITLPMGAPQPQQFFASLGQSQASTLILDTTSNTPLVQMCAQPVSGHNLSHANSIGVKCIRNMDSKNNISANNADLTAKSVNVERGCQASISDDELTCDNIKTTATQVDMDAIHSSEEDDDNEGKCHKLRLFSERKAKESSEKKSSVNDDESSSDSLQLQIVDEMASDEPPQLPVKSAPVMQFIDHHGLDLLVDSIEEFAREESTPSANDLAVNGLQLLSTLAEQRSREERSADNDSPLRRHSADSSITIYGLNSKTIVDTNPAKRKQRSESCFTTNPIKCDQNKELLTDFKKLMRTSGSQTDDRRGHKLDNSLSLRRSERIFINDSFVSNGTLQEVKIIDKEVSKDVSIDATKDRDLSNAKEVKRKDNSEPKSRAIQKETKACVEKQSQTRDESLVSNNDRPKDQYVFTGTKCDEMVSNLNTFSVISNKHKINDNFVFCDISKSNNQKSISDSAKEKPRDGNNEKGSELKKKVKKKKKKSAECESGLNGSQTEEKIVKAKKRKKKTNEGLDNNKKLKSDYDKQIDDSIESIIKRVSQIDETIDDLHSHSSDKSSDVVNKSVAETKTSDETINKLEETKDIKESKDSDEHNKEKAKKRSKDAVVKQSFELYDQKRMKLLDQTIDEIIANQSLLPSIDFEEHKEDETIVKEDSIPKPIETNVLTNESESSAAKPHKTNYEEVVVPVKSETQKSKPLVKQTSSASSVCSSATSSSDSCNSSAAAPNLKLSEAELDLKLNVIMLVDSLLFVGEICPIQPPDIYGIVLHGERQHRPLIYSQEQMLREAIREVKPTLEELEEGQRVCAYWSIQYRHLYPGYVRSSSPHPNLVFIEFDDGDNGRIAIDDIRLLPQDYPKMEINADPMKNLERRRRMSSSCKDSRSGKHSSDSVTNDRSDEKKEEQTKSCKSTVNEDYTKTNSVKESSNKRDNESKNKSNKSCNTINDSKTSHDSINDTSNLKSEAKKKKKKHNKEDRHHRHHHNHKHHHCRHHRKCKKHKKSSKEDINTNTSHSSSNNMSNDSKTADKNDKTIEINAKSTKTIATKANSRDSKQESTKETDAQNVDDSKQIDSKTETPSSSGPKKEVKKPLRTVIKKTPEQRALDRLQTNLSESFITISSPIRAVKRLNTDGNASAPSPKKRERMPSAEKSKIAAFLPHRQLWHWSGKCIRRTGVKGSRTRKMYYQEIERGRERIKVDDCAVFLSTGRPHLPYIGRIDSMWQTGSGTMIVKVRWFYHPEETKGQPVPLLDKRGALFESSHFDVNDVQTISHKCQVISWTEYQEKRRENPFMASEDPPNVYYCAGKYDALGGHIDMDSSVPLKDKSTNNTTDKSDKPNDKLDQTN